MIILIISTFPNIKTTVVCLNTIYRYKKTTTDHEIHSHCGSVLEVSPKDNKYLFYPGK
jgi:hypothetical protein